MGTRSKHLLVDLYACDKAVLNDVSRLERLLTEAASSAGARVVAQVFHGFAPHGVTGVVVVEESHLSIHTWPELGYAAVDFYTCGELRTERAIELLATGVQAGSVEVLEVARGAEQPSRTLEVRNRRRWDL